MGFSGKNILNESTRDNFLIPYVNMLKEKGIETNLGELKRYLLRKFVEEGDMRNLSLGSNFYLAGVARYYFNGDLTENQELGIFTNQPDQFKEEICKRLNALILILRNSYIDSVGTKFEQPEDFGTLSLEKLLKKYSKKIDKELGIEVNKPKETPIDTNESVGNGYTFDILYKYPDATKYYKATQPGAWCITYGKQHYDSYIKLLKIHYVIFRKNGWENVPREKGPDWTSQKPQDEYGSSLIAVLQSNNSWEPVYITSRWNHGYFEDNSQCEADHAFTTQEFMEKTGVSQADLERIFNIWKANKAKDKGNGAKAKELAIERTTVVRHLKYAQMRINGGENPLTALGVSSPDDMILIVGNGKPSKSIVAYKFSIRGTGNYAVMVDRNQIIYESAVSEDNFRDGDYVKTYSYTNTETSYYEWIKDAIVIQKNPYSQKYMIYNIKKHKFLDIDGTKVFGHLMDTSTYTGRKTPNFYEIKQTENQMALIDCNTNEPLVLPNGHSWFEGYKSAVDDFNMRNKKSPRLLSLKGLIYIDYDTSANEGYFYSTDERKFVDIELPKEDPVNGLNSIAIGGKPLVMVSTSRNGSWSNIINYLYWFTGEQRYAIGDISSFSSLYKLPTAEHIFILRFSSLFYLRLWSEKHGSFIYNPTNGELFAYKNSSKAGDRYPNLLYLNNEANNSWYLFDTDKMAFLADANNNLKTLNGITIITQDDWLNSLTNRMLEGEHNWVSAITPNSSPLHPVENNENSTNNGEISRNSTMNENTIKTIIRESLRRILAENQQDELIAYHGTVNKFDKFNWQGNKHSGEGSARYGEGIYLTNVVDTGLHYAAKIVGKKYGKNVIKFYKKMASTIYYINSFILTHSRLAKFKHFNVYDFEYWKKIFLSVLLGNWDEYKDFWGDAKPFRLPVSKKIGEKLAEDMKNMHSWEDFQQYYSKVREDLVHNYERYLVTVDIPDSGYIRWDETNPDIIYGVLQSIRKKTNNTCPDGKPIPNFRSFRIFGDLYDKLIKLGFNSYDLTKMIEYSGIYGKKPVVGIIVPTGFQLGGDLRGENFVIFDDKNVKILKRKNLKTGEVDTFEDSDEE